MDSAKETVESTIKLAESKIFKLLDEKLKTISNIDDLDTINTAVLHGIISANQAYSPEATYSWNKAAGKAVLANVISNGIWIFYRILGFELIKLLSIFDKVFKFIFAIETNTGLILISFINNDHISILKLIFAFLK